MREGCQAVGADARLLRVVDDGADDVLHLVVDIKGYRREDDFKTKVETEFNKMIGGTLEREGVMP